jgi:viroplasmin and RNaseH domain-containing protein
LCPDCRQQRRISFRNFYKLYKSKCSATGENMVSMYSPDKNLTVYHQDFWWSDKWSAFDYGVDFDFDKSFFEQFEEFFNKIPKINLINFESENIEYSNFSKASKNCYLVS